MPRLGKPQPAGSGSEPLQNGYDRRKTLALLGALCFFLSAVEYLIPKPLPFMRIGLANMPLLLALNILGAKDFFLLVVLKVLGQGLIGGTFLSFIFLFSIAGTFTSATVMYALSRMPGRRYLGFTGISCAGAMVSNSVQLLFARHLVFGEAVRYLAPPFLAAGFVAGVTLGIVCEYFCRHSRWYALRVGRAVDLGQGGDPGVALLGVPPPMRIVPRKDRRLRRSQRWDELFKADELFVAGLFMALIFLHDRTLPGLITHFLFFCLLVWVSGRRNNYIATAGFIVGIVFFNLLVPHGRVLLTLGPLQITQGSLFAGLERAITLSGLMMLSRVCVRNDLRLPGSIGSLLAEALRMLELMRGKLRKMNRGQIIAGIDGIMLEVETAPPAGDGDLLRKKPRRNTKGILVLLAIVVLTAAIGPVVALY
ncbi:MAG: Gx transporter family protein [Treponema sp.]|nr:Gx transporter family protein [Treponema sp.]